MDYPKIQVKIVFDIDKINVEKKLSLKSMMDIVDETAQNAGMIKLDELLYETAGNNHDLQCISNFTFRSLAKCEWFTSNIKEWTMIHPYERASDIVALCKKYELGNYKNA